MVRSLDEGSFGQSSDNGHMEVLYNTMAQALEVASDKVRALRLVLGNTLAPPTPREMQEAPGLPQGLAKGSVVELLGPARTEWLCEFLRINSEHQIFWCDRNQAVVPTALHQRGVELSRITFGTFGEADFLKPIRQILQAQLFQAVVAPNLFSDINAFKAFQLLSEKSNANLFLMGNKTPSTAWPISTQLEISRNYKSKTFDIEVIRQKHTVEA